MRAKYDTIGSQATQAIGQFDYSRFQTADRQAAYDIATKEPFTIAKVFHRYLKLVEQMAEMTDDDLSIVLSSIALLGGSTVGASGHSLPDLLAALDADQRTLLRTSISAAADPESPAFAKAINELTTMMEKGHQFKLAGKTPTDGDPESDALIWGHTQLTDPFVLIEFTVCHYIERYMTAVFREVIPDIANRKDWFLNALTDVIALNYVRGSLSSRVAEVWLRPRAEGGLGWLKPGRIAAFEKVINRI